MNTPTKYCPSCNRRMPKPRVEKLKPTLVKALQKIYKLAGMEFVKVPAYVFKAQHSRLKHWGLIEEQVVLRKNGTPHRRPGVWRVTELGEEFLAGFNRQPSELFLEKDRVILRGSVLLTIDEVSREEIPYNSTKRDDESEEGEEA